MSSARTMAVSFVILLLFFEPILSDDRASWVNRSIIEFIKLDLMTKIRHQRRTFLENLAKIEEHNENFRKGLVSYRLVMNQFGHLDDKEFRKMCTNPQTDEVDLEPRDLTYFQFPKNVTLPKAVDWRLRGALTEVKSQEPCGCCYAFAAIATIESQYYTKHNKLVEFSEQQVVDCGRPPKLDGCDGGRRSDVYSYATDVGLTTTKLYPYIGAKLPCRLKNSLIRVKIKGFDRMPPNSVADMTAAVALRGPVSIGLSANALKFITGKEVLTGHWCQGPINHAVVVVGYNTTPEGQDYWIVRNSWGKMWGDKGYYLLERNNADECRLATKVLVPNIV